ncbi:Protein FAM47E [Tupaia chinensis]|uniref:Protein FAM47E n=1 Tax=Tupaia chinensis TaxID=246437 RepID=L8Y9I7_TUPCH|nr:Protein FAM47E [Tupaia chinensis]
MANRRQPTQPRWLQPMPLGMQCKPWYKDRLPSKCFAKHKNKLLKFPTTLDSRQWIFVKEGLDDFRKGCPPCENMITRGAKKAFLPMISQRVPHPPPKKSQRKLPKETAPFSRLSAAQQARRKFVEDIEASLTRQPLALLSDMEEALPPDLLLKVLEVLDPDRKLEDTWAYCEGDRKSPKKSPKFSKQHCKKVLWDLPKTPFSYREPHEEEPNLKDPFPKHVPRAVRKLCRWIRTFGDLGIDEDFIMKQFEISIESKPRYDKYQMKKINHLPWELKYSEGLNETEEVLFSIEEIDWERKLEKPQNPYKPNWVKTRYGAWYLKPKLWKKLRNDEPLIDPKLLEVPDESSEYDILEDLYGTLAFKDFILSKGYRMPGIIEKLFTRKKWNYETVCTPIPRIVKTYTLPEEDDSWEYTEGESFEEDGEEEDAFEEEDESEEEYDSRNKVSGYNIWEDIIDEWELDEEEYVWEEDACKEDACKEDAKGQAYKDAVGHAPEVKKDHAPTDAEDGARTDNAGDWAPTADAGDPAHTDDAGGRAPTADAGNPAPTDDVGDRARTEDAENHARKDG